MNLNVSRHWLALLWLPLCMCMQLPASAQVQRCTDASGHVTYTDGQCVQGQRAQEVVPELSPQDRAQQQALYAQALERRREEKALQMQRDAVRQAEQQAKAAALAPQRLPAPIVVEVAAPESPPSVVYSPMYPPPRPPHLRPPVPPPHPPATGYHCNVFRCYDGKGHSWSRP